VPSLVSSWSLVAFRGDFGGGLGTPKCKGPSLAFAADSPVLDLFLNCSELKLTDTPTLAGIFLDYFRDFRLKKPAARGAVTS
jgi:hypothetical protein